MLSKPPKAAVPKITIVAARPAAPASKIPIAIKTITVNGFGGSAWPPVSIKVITAKIAPTIQVRIALAPYIARR